MTVIKNAIKSKDYSASGDDKSGTDMNKFWQRLDRNDKEIVTYFVYAAPPVSVDALSSLSGASAVQILNVMEKLKRKGIAVEKKGFGRGVYFLRDAGLVSFVQEHMIDNKIEGVTGKIIDYCTRSLPDGEQKTLVLANLYRKFDTPSEGLSTIKSAADILSHNGEKTKAAALYNHLIQYFSDKVPSSELAGLFLDSVIGQIHIMMHRMPLNEQIALLTKAEEIARKYKMWDRLARISIWLGRALQDAGQHRKASRCISDFLSLSEKIEDPGALKATALAVAEYYVWKGKFVEAARQYEQIVGEREEFGDNEMVLLASQVVGFGHALSGRISRGLGMIDAVRIKAGLLNLQEVVNYCDQASIMALLEIRRVDEAEFYVNRLAAFPPEVLGPFMEEALCEFRAFIHCAKGDYEGAFEFLKKRAELSRTMGRTHNPSAWAFETLMVLETKGYSHEEYNLESFVSKMLDWDDIYMKGVAYRYRALRTMEKDGPPAKALSDLLNSEKYLKRSGAEIELARTRIALGKYYLANGEQKTARLHLSKAWEFFSTIDRSLFPPDLLDAMPQEQRVEFMIERVTKINESLGTLRDMSSFLERVINVAMDFTVALRGAFIVRENDELKIIASRNLDPTLFNTEKFRKVREFMMGTMTAGTELFIPFVETQNDGSIQAASANSLICMPAKLGDEIVGYLCLDGRIGKDPFPHNQIPFVRMLCSQIAVGLSNIRIYEELREQRDRLEDEAVFYKKEMGVAGPTTMIIGKSTGIGSVLDQIQQVAPTDSLVLILGETGVGKELVAKAIHSLSTRKDGAFIPVNLSALPQELITSELFGHEKGAFTGAHESHRGRFELADGGTIFLDEIGDLPASIQVKLLRVLQEGTFERLGSSKQIHSHFRVIAATNKDLHSEVDKGTFRQDLYYRLNVFPIYVPPLRERKDDLSQLANHFMEKFGKKLGKRLRSIAPQELKKLLDYHWPGNVRELEHFIERAIILSDGHSISFSGLKQTWSTPTPEDDQPIRPLEEIERAYVRKALAATGWRVSGPRGAAYLLGLKTSTLRFRMDKLGIKKPGIE
jgi:transcriptional regulator with GAF, ATPase, and Fis domain/tetratricopeptide (TPR) repeat protein